VAAVNGADDITIPVGQGNIVIRPAFLRGNVPELSLKIKNQTAYSWRTLKLRFDIGCFCNGEPRRWTVPVTTSLGWAEDHPVVKEYVDTVIPLVGKVDGCDTEIITAKLVFAENSKTRIDGVSGETIDLENQLQEITKQREAEAALQADQERQAAEAEAKKAAAEAERRRRLAAEGKRKEAEEVARQAKIRAEQDAKAAAERARVRAACASIYKATADKKLSDVTVKEAQQIEACRTLGMYPPQ
jgi:hypothetical protein